MSVADAIRKMNLSELTCFEDAVRALVKRQRKVLLDPMIQNKMVVGVIQKTKARAKGQKRRAFRLNAQILDSKRGTLTIEVMEPEAFRGQKMTADPEFLYEPFGSPGETQVL